MEKDELEKDDFGKDEFEKEWLEKDEFRKDELGKDELGKDEWKRRIFRRWRRCTVKIESESWMVWKDKETKERRVEGSYISVSFWSANRNFSCVVGRLFLAVTSLAVGTWTTRYVDWYLTILPPAY